jgi:hypothetical protein
MTPEALGGQDLGIFEDGKTMGFKHRRT